MWWFSFNRIGESPRHDVAWVPDSIRFKAVSSRSRKHQVCYFTCSIGDTQRFSAIQLMLEQTLPCWQSSRQLTVVNTPCHDSCVDNNHCIQVWSTLLSQESCPASSVKNTLPIFTFQVHHRQGGLKGDTIGDLMVGWLYFSNITQWDPSGRDFMM